MAVYGNIPLGVFDPGVRQREIEVAEGVMPGGPPQVVPRGPTLHPIPQELPPPPSLLSLLGGEEQPDAFVGRVNEMLSEEEGRIEGAYLDSLGKPTAGVGHLLTGAELGEVTVTDPEGNVRKLSDLSPKERETIRGFRAEQLGGGDVRQGPEGGQYTFHAPTFTNTRIDDWLASDSSAALDRARSLSQELNHLYEDAGDDDFLLRLTSMYFQMPEWERKFPMASKALRRGDKKEAAVQLLTVAGAGTEDSRWLGQTPKRANAAAEAFRGLTHATDYEWDMYGESGLGDQQTAEDINGLAISPSLGGLGSLGPNGDVGQIVPTSMVTSTSPSAVVPTMNLPRQMPPIPTPEEVLQIQRWYQSQWSLPRPPSQRGR